MKYTILCTGMTVEDKLLIIILPIKGKIAKTEDSLFIKLLYSHIINMHIYTYTCRIHIDAIITTSEAMKTNDTVLRKIYLSLYLKGFV